MATGRNHSSTIEQQLALGHQIVAYLREQYPECQEAGRLKCFDEDFHFPWGFFRKYVESRMNATFTSARRMQCKRAFELVQRANELDAVTDAGERDGRKLGSRRCGNTNSSKSSALSVALFQVFVDDFVTLYSRADSALLLKEARKLRKLLQTKALVRG